MAFTTGYFALFIQGSYQVTKSDIDQINNLKSQFQKKVDPIIIINFNSLYFSDEQFRLLDPVVSITGTDSSLEKKNRFETNQDCRRPFGKLINHDNFEKVWIWEEFRCQRRKVLPRSFFYNPPFMHPSGKSFAYLAYKLGKNSYDDESWVMGHLPFFHVGELSRVRNRFGPFKGIFEILQSIGKDSLTGLIKGEGTILTEDYLFARLKYPQIFNILEYRIYTRASLNLFLKDSPFMLYNFQAGRPCFYRDGPLCWGYNVKHIFKLANTSTIGLFLGLIIIILVVVRLLLVKIKAQRLEDEKRRLALRVLTHEFRTPITTLTLLLEKMGNSYNRFDEDMEGVYLCLSREVHRLRRLTETSRNYLKAEQSEKLINLNFEKIESINQFIENSLDPFQESHFEDIHFEKLENDTSLLADPYWLNICFKNILENALNHGKPPVIVRLFQIKGFLCLEIEDQGHCEFIDLAEMSKEFVKGNKSTGTGLGMNIVIKVCKEMGVEIELRKGPTNFTLKIPTRFKSE